MNVLVSSAGRRGALIRLIRQTVRPLGGRVVAIDAAAWSSACRLADAWCLVPPFKHDAFFDAVASFCQQHSVQLIVPTHDRELPVYARLRPRFADLGIHVACCGPKSVEIAADKQRTHEFLMEANLPSVTQIPLAMAQAMAADLTAPLPFPLVIKPRCGSCSKGVYAVRDRDELAFYLKRTDDPLVQQQVQGREFTTNFLVGRDGRCRVAVPHWRIETRGGEVSKCMTVRQPQLMRMAHQLALALPDAYGPLCFQAFVDDRNEVKIIELNARFGGGYPIAHAAGANFVQMMIDELSGRPGTPPAWTDGLAMTRWDDAVFWQVREATQCA
jgi:carbamoyl-phosphate synthase large subunit